jgi:CPA2 family monovalent cation:H+ antiporter-2
VETDIRPFHDVLLLFISIGVMLDWRIVLSVGRRVLLLASSRWCSSWCWSPGWLNFGATPVCRCAPAYLAQVGEFGAVVTGAKQRAGAARPDEPILASMVLSMLATPFIIIMHSNTIMKLVSSEWLQQSLQMTTIARKSINVDKHVIICWLGVATKPGQMLARKHPCIALDLT